MPAGGWERSSCFLWPGCKHGTTKSSVNSQYLGSVLGTSFSFQMHKSIGQAHPGGTAELQGCRRSALVAVPAFCCITAWQEHAGGGWDFPCIHPKTGQRSAPAAAAKHRSALAWVPGQAVLPPAAAPRTALPLLKLQPSQGFPCNSLCAWREEFKTKKTPFDLLCLSASPMCIFLPEGAVSPSSPSSLAPGDPERGRADALEVMKGR